MRLEPGPHAFARLLRLERPTKGGLFGPDVGMEPEDGDDGDDGDDDDEDAVDGVDDVERAPTSGPMQNARPANPPDVAILRDVRVWTARCLGVKRGVLAAFPGARGMDFRPSQRVLALGQGAAVGHARWWLRSLARTPFGYLHSYATPAREKVYRVGKGPPDWFPAGPAYGMERGEIGRFLHFGITVGVTRFGASALTPTFDAQVHQLAESAYLLLDAATHGIAPAVFAAMLVVDADDYRPIAELDDLACDMPCRASASASATPAGPAASPAASRVDGMVVVSQLHTFRMSDMLAEYADAAPTQRRTRAHGELSLAVGAVMDKLERLASLKIVKLSCTPDAIVFCPELTDAETASEYDLAGFACGDAVRGKPFLVDYDPRLCKRLRLGDRVLGYDAHCALVLMATILLASTRASHEGAYAVLRTAVCESRAFVAALSGVQAENRADAFVDMLRAVFQHTRVEREPLPNLVLLQMSQDALHALRQPASYFAGPLVVAETGRPLFESLLQCMLPVQSVPSTAVSTEATLLARREARARERARLDAVQAASMRRLAQRRDAALRV